MMIDIITNSVKMPACFSFYGLPVDSVSSSVAQMVIDKYLKKR